MAWSGEEAERLAAGAAEWGLPLSARQAEQFAELAGRLAAGNERLNLTRVAPEEFVTRHFLDSLSVLAAHGPADGARTLDVGTGAGFPGAALAIVRPDLEVTLLDSVKKRLDWLAGTLSAIGLSNIATLHARAEDAARDPAHRERYDLVTARAVAAMPALAELCLPFARVGGAFVAMKSAGAEAEIAAARRAIGQLGGRLERTVPLRIPGTDPPLERLLAVVAKAKRTPELFPRPPARLREKPL